MINWIKDHPVYVYGIFATVTPIITYYLTQIGGEQWFPEELWLAVAGAALAGGSRAVTKKVTPENKVQPRVDKARAEGMAIATRHPSSSSD